MAAHSDCREAVRTAEGVLTVRSCSEELRSRFVKAESTLFRIRYDDTNQDEREAFLAELKIDLDVVGFGHHDYPHFPSTCPLTKRGLGRQ